MRTTGDDNSDTRPLGDETSSGTGTPTDPIPTDPTDPTHTDPTPGNVEPTSIPEGGPPSPSGDDLGPGGDTDRIDDILNDLSEEEAEEVVSDVFESVYGSDSERILEEIQGSLGLDFRDILDILVSQPGQDSYGEGAPGNDVDDTIGSDGTDSSSTGTFDPTADMDEPSSRYFTDTDEAEVAGAAWGEDSSHLAADSDMADGPVKDAGDEAFEPG